MAIFRGSMIRGEQIKDRSIQGDQILQSALANEHIAANAAIAESKLAIDWHAHKETLIDRKIVDFIQVNGILASGTEVDLEAQVPAIVGVAKAGSVDSVEGIITEGVRNVVPMRDAITGEPLVAEIGGIDYEVIARMEHVNGKFVVRFYTASGANGEEILYNIGTNPITVDLQYARRFNLATVDEMFAANEKFVHGAADVTAYLNIQQLAKDVYGSAWHVDRDGEANLGVSVVDQITAEKNRAQFAETALQQAIDDEEAARVSADTTLDNKIAAEATARQNADTTLQSNIDAEKNARIAADDAINSALQNEIEDRQSDTAALNTLISNEANARANADTQITNNLNSEISTRAAADTALSNRIDAEVAARTSGDLAIRTDLASTTPGKGAELIGISAIPGLAAGTVQEALQQLKTNAGDALVSLKQDLLSNADGKGANLIAVEAGHGFTGTTVEEVLENHEARLDTIEASINAVGARSASMYGYFTAGTFATVDERFESDEAIIDANFKRVDDRNTADRTRQATTYSYFTNEVKATLKDRFADIETLVDAKAREIDTARGNKSSLNERLSVAVRADGYLVDDAKLHVHKKYTYTVSANQTRLNLPAGEYFNLSSATGSGSIAIDTVQVYINGILQANGINFTEIADSVKTTKGIAVDFSPEELVTGDVIVIEWVVNNAN